jgi:DNA-binding NtrC family response regulator
VNRIFVIDDEAAMGENIQRLLKLPETIVTAYTDPVRGLADALAKPPDLVLLDMRMSGMSGEEVFARLHEAHPGVRIVFLTAFGSVESAVLAMRQGAFDYLQKPFGREDLLLVVKRALSNAGLEREVERLKGRLDALGESDHPQSRIAAMLELIGKAQRAAATDATVMILGESGSGKEVMARYIHSQSRRRNGSYVPVECSALPGSLIESELFGYERGAFSGAQNRKKGKFEVADGGAVFLDEVSEISLKTQADLVRVLEESEIKRLGGTQSIRVDFRCIAATRKSLEELVGAGAYGPELYSRLSAFVIDLPPLRRRREDIPLLADHFLRRFATAMNKPLPRLSSLAAELLLGYDWPGNVRELENAIERAMVIGREPEIQAADFPFQLAPTGPETGHTLEQVERVHIERVLRETKGNLSRAARILDIDRTTLYNKLRRYGLK